jgi:hypothetical protein
MPYAPAGVVSAQISGDRQQPCGKFAFEIKPATTVIDPDECFFGKFDRVGVVPDVSQDERVQRLLPTLHQLIKRRVVAFYQADHAQMIWIVGFRHSDKKWRVSTGNKIPDLLRLFRPC